MFKTELEYGSYYDFFLTKDCRPFVRDYDYFKLFYIDVTKDLCSTVGVKQGQDILLQNISLTGYDNFFIPPVSKLQFVWNTTANTWAETTVNWLNTPAVVNFGGNVIKVKPDVIDTETEYVVTSGDTLCLHSVSGYTSNLKYDISPKLNYNQLFGGFYQGFFKLFGYPVEFMPTRMRKGWTTNMMLHFPITGNTTGVTSGTTLNDVFDNEGFIYYIGTRAENKYSELTNVEVTRLKNEYNFTFTDTDNLYTKTGVYLLNGQPYAGYYYTKDGIAYAGRNSTDINIINNYIYDSVFNIDGVVIPGGNMTGTITGTTKLTYFNGYKDIIDNSFGVRVLPDGRIGYRTIYSTDPCYTGATQEVSGITNNSFIDFSNDCDDFTIGKIITKYFTIEESYTREPVINVNDTKFLLVSVTFERDFSYEGTCLLKYGQYRNGTLSISLNGFTVYRNRKFKEFIPHELDAEAKYQEAVPFNISFGGGTQGLYDAVYLDLNKEIEGTIEKFFAGTFNGGVSFIEMYSIPLYVTEIRDIIKNKLQNYNLYYPKGGRRVFIKNIM